MSDIVNKFLLELILASQQAQLHANLLALATAASGTAGAAPPVPTPVVSRSVAAAATTVTSATQVNPLPEQTSNKRKYEEQEEEKDRPKTKHRATPCSDILLELRRRVDSNTPYAGKDRRDQLAYVQQTHRAIRDIERALYDTVPRGSYEESAFRKACGEAKRWRSQLDTYARARETHTEGTARLREWFDPSMHAPGYVVIEPCDPQTTAPQLRKQLEKMGYRINQLRKGEHSHMASLSFLNPEDYWFYTYRLGDEKLMRNRYVSTSFLYVGRAKDRAQRS